MQLGYIRNQGNTREDALNMTEHEALTVEHARACIDTLRAERDHLSEALGSHDLVWRAKAWMVHDMHITPDEAHDLLWSQSQSTNTRVAEIARRIVAEHER